MVKGPKSVTCYLCGRSYGTSSIKIHEPRCEKLYLEREAKKPKSQRRPLPPRPTIDVHEAGVDVYNDVAFESYNDALIPCENCNRTFTERALSFHRKACSSSNPLKPLNKPTASSSLTATTKETNHPVQEKKKSTKPKGPVTVICHICGKQYGRSSFQIHLKQCEKLFLEREKLKPKNQRRSLPTAPESNHTNVEQYNSEAFEVFNNESLLPCECCGRTFLPKALEIHRKSCSRDAPAKRLSLKK